ncbi:MAG: cysteine--tRNA ligase [Janthinobacterium lividum]
MSLHLHNTLTRKLEIFQPLDADHIRMYVCGPTVYDRAHLGNFRPIVVFDVLFRLLKHFYPKVTYVRNITDIDDKIMDAAQKKGRTIDQITQETTCLFHDDIAALNVLAPTVEPRATDHVIEMIDLIKVLLEKELAYEAQGHVLYHVPALKCYGQLSNICVEDMRAGARIDVAPYKKDPADFVLWKPSDVHQPGWESPWGRGRPGWHIECSAMSLKHLGVSFDIHGGGQDLIFPHHENEMAQSIGAHGFDTFARYWLHNGVLTVNGEKMSKSLGNFVTMVDLAPKAKGETLRFALLSAHYRQSLDFTDDTLIQAAASLNRLYGALEGFLPNDQSADIDPKVIEALADDLNTPLAIAALHALAREIYKLPHGQARRSLQQILYKSGGLLGLLQKDPKLWFQETTANFQGLSSDMIEDWIVKRMQARAQKDFAESDRIRDFLKDQGITLLDSSTGTTWRRDV